MTETTRQAPERYSIAICKGSALLDETAALLRAWRPGESLDAFAERVLREDVLGKSTAYRVRDIVRRVFAPRFLRPDDRHARQVQALLSGAGKGAIREPTFVFACRNDPLLRDATLKVYWPAARIGQLSFGAQDLLPFIHAATEAGHIPEPWSEQVTIKVARGIVGAWTGFGLLTDRSRGKHQLASFQISDRMTVYLAYLLHYDGVTDAQVVAHPDWALFGLAAEDVAGRLARLSNAGWWEAQGSVAFMRVTWNYGSMDEVVDALAR